jgi:hypothetical protein
MDTKLSKEVTSYLSAPQKDLISQGLHLLDHVKTQDGSKFTDFSFVVFPFAKAYEGFLKQVFLDAGYITQKDYVSKFFRVGKVLSPNLVKRLGKKSVYKQICDSVGCGVGEQAWLGWRRARNEVFHYFPHNVHSLTLQEAEEAIFLLIDTMNLIVDEVGEYWVKRKLVAMSSTA